MYLYIFRYFRGLFARFAAALFTYYIPNTVLTSLPSFFLLHITELQSYGGYTRNRPGVILAGGAGGVLLVC